MTFMARCMAAIERWPDCIDQQYGCRIPPDYIRTPKKSLSWSAVLPSVCPTVRWFLPFSHLLLCLHWSFPSWPCAPSAPACSVSPPLEPVPSPRPVSGRESIVHTLNKSIRCKIHSTGWVNWLKLFFGAGNRVVSGEDHILRGLILKGNQVNRTQWCGY